MKVTFCILHMFTPTCKASDIPYRSFFKSISESCTGITLSGAYVDFLCWKIGQLKQNLIGQIHCGNVSFLKYSLRFPFLRKILYWKIKGRPWTHPTRALVPAFHQAYQYVVDVEEEHLAIHGGAACGVEFQVSHWKICSDVFKRF